MNKIVCRSNNLYNLALRLCKLALEYDQILRAEGMMCKLELIAVLDICNSL